MSSNSSSSRPAAAARPRGSPSPSNAPPPSPSTASSSPAPSEPSGSSPPPPAPARSHYHGAPFSPAKTHPPPTEQPSRSAPSSPPVSTHRSGPTMAEVVFAAAGAAALLVILIAACVCCSRRTAPRRRKRPHNPMHYYADSSSVFKGSSTYYPSGPQPQWQSDTGAAATTSTFGPPGGGWHAPPPDMTSGLYSSPHGAALPPPPPHDALGLGKGTFTYEQLAAATANFSPANLLGQGGFGYVHKGVLPGGRAVALKQLKPGSGQGEREFQAEVDIISRVHHRHLVSLVGYCIAGARRVLVYEFVPNKTLEFHLHGQERAAGDAVVDEASHRAGVGERARLPARRLPSSDHSPRHQVCQHSPRQQLRSNGRGLRAGQAELRQQHARLDPGHGDVRVPGAGVRVEREADGEVGRVLLRRDAAGAPDGAAARGRRRGQLVPGGRPRGLGEAGPVARAGRRRLRRRRGPEVAGQLRPRRDGAGGRQRRRRRPPLGQEAPQDEPDREGAGGGDVAGGPERGGPARAEHDVRHGGGGGLVQDQQGSRGVHVRHGADQAGAHGDPGVQRRGRRVRPPLAARKRGVLRRRRFGSGQGSPVAGNGYAVYASDAGPLQFMLAAPVVVDCATVLLWRP